jgi:branched-chain amino acid transport system permease protein
MTDLLNQILIFAIFAVSLNLLLGYAGQVSMAHAAFGGIGGYSVAYMSVEQGVSLELSLLIGIVLGALAGFLIGLPALRLRMEYVLLLTIAFQTIFVQVVENADTFGGIYGLPLKDVTFFGVDSANAGELLIPLIVFAAIVIAICVRIGESPFGRVLRGIREDEVAVRSLGKPVGFDKLLVFTVTSGMAALAGGLLAIYSQLAAGGEYGFDQSMAIISMVIIGGMGSPLGAFAGAALVEFLQYALTEWLSVGASNAGTIRLIAYGVLVLFFLGVRPGGLLAERTRKLAPKGGVTGAKPVVAAAVAPPPVADAPGGDVLVVEHLAKRFGGIAAVQGADFSLRRGSITALVGPNGAGKTTIFSLLTGFIKPDQGSVQLNGVELVGKLPEQIAKMGMVRSFQDARVLGRMTALENVALGVQGNVGEQMSALFLRPRAVSAAERETRAEAMRWLEFVDLAAAADQPVSSLAYGEQKRVALARVLATEADVLLLDEPTAGIDPAALDGMLALVERVRDLGRTVCIVEHNLEVVGRLAEIAYFLDVGKVVARGPIQELMSEDKLVEVYFGAH